jgi:8-oxo-dGTP diphosphatase
MARKEVHTVTGFLESEGQILLLLRSNQVRTFRETWAGVAGLIDEGKTADEQVILEIQEETGLGAEDIQLIKKGEPFIFHDANRDLKKVIYPYLFHVKDRRKVRLDWEHTDCKWIKPEEMGQYPTMPKLKETLERVL